MRMKFTFFAALFALVNTALYAQEQINVVLPATPFNKEEAKSMLSPGTASMKGYVMKKKRNARNTYLGIVVALFPCTPYFNEWYELQKKNKKGKTLAVMSPEAYSYRILTKASDTDGSFEFRDLKPGKYYLQTTVRQGQMEEMWNRVGTATSTGYNIYGQAVTSFEKPIYEDFKLFYETTDLVKTFVEITSEGQVVNVKL